MNENKTKKTRSISLQRTQSAQRRVSFSKPWSQRPLGRACSISRRANDKSNPVPCTVTYTRLNPSKPCLKTDNSRLISSKGVGTRNKQKDATSSTVTDTRRRSNNDPTPAHLKYGMFRKFSKIKKPSADISSVATPRVSQTIECKPVLVGEQSEMFRRKQKEEFDRHRIAPVMTAPPKESETPPLPLNTRHVHLRQTEPVHLDIKPKRFPSMLWC